MRINVTECYKPLYTSKKPIILITGGRGSGKSFQTSLFIKRLTYERGHKILFTRYTMDSAEKSVIPEFTQKIELERDAKYFQVTNKNITNLYSGSGIMFSGIKTSSGNQTAKLKSIQGLTTFVIDEAEEWTNYDEFEKLSLSIRTKGVQNRIIIIMNPSDTNHWVWQKYFENNHTTVNIEGEQIQISTHPEIEHIHTTYHVNEQHLSDKFLNEVAYMREHDYKNYIHKVLGKWVTQREGVIYTNWTRGNFDENLPFIYGLDWGSTDPFAVVKVAVDVKHRKIYVDEIDYAIGRNTAQIHKVLFNNVGKKSVIVYDSANKQAGNDLIYAGFNAYPANKKAVLFGIQSIQGFQIIVTPTSYNVIKELNNYIWLDTKANTPEDANNHALDALRYAFLWLTNN